MPIFGGGKQKEVEQALGQILEILTDLQGRVVRDIDALKGVKLEAAKLGDQFALYTREAGDVIRRWREELDALARRYAEVMKVERDLSGELGRLRNLLNSVEGSLQKAAELAERLAAAAGRLAASGESLASMVDLGLVKDLLKQSEEILKTVEGVRLEERTRFYAEKISQVVKDVERGQQQAASLREQLRELEQSISALREKAERLKREEQDAEAKLKELEGRRRGLEGEIERLESQRRALEEYLKGETVRYMTELEQIRKKLFDYIDLIKLRYEELIEYYKTADPEKARQLVEAAGELWMLEREGRYE
jgi:chromosome segregation ATPase